jgi:hypothetical protein
MPELKHGFERKLDFVQDSVDIDEIPYHDKNREIQRKKKMLLQKTLPKPIFVKKMESWSIKKETKDKRDERRVKKSRKKLFLLMKKAEGSNLVTKPTIGGKTELDDDFDCAADYKEYLKDKK